MHSKIVHEKLKEFKCTHCNNSYGRGFELKNHINNVHENLKLKCRFCDKMFATTRLNAHIREIHGKPKQYNCDICQKSLKRRSELKRHIDVVHEKQKNHKCTSCDMSFGMKQALEKHIISIHEQQKYFECSNCEKRFTSDTYLKEL